VNKRKFYQKNRKKNCQKEYGRKGQGGGFLWVALSSFY
jgi:hypothetical protein